MPPNPAEKLTQLKTLKIGDDILNIGTYYYDHQIFVKSIDSKVSEQKLHDYFSQFGTVEHIVMTEPRQKHGQSLRSCYIKMADDKVVNSIILGGNHAIDGQDVRCVRTFGLDEDKESDKKMFLLIEGNIGSQEEFEQKAIEYFTSFGKIRERPKVENTNNNKHKMNIFFVNHEDAGRALEAFNSAPWVQEYKEKKVTMKFSFFHSKENKIYVMGLKDVSEKVVKDAFSIFGEITEVTCSKLKNGLNVAIVAFANEYPFHNPGIATKWPSPPTWSTKASTRSSPAAATSPST